MSSFIPDEGFTYPDPSFYGLTRPLGLHMQPHQAAPTAAPGVPTTALVPAPSTPPLALDPSLLPGSTATPFAASAIAAGFPIPAVIAGPILASFAGPPRVFPWVGSCSQLFRPVLYLRCKSMERMPPDTTALWRVRYFNSHEHLKI